MRPNEPIAAWLASLRVQHAFLGIGRIGDAAAVRLEPEGEAAFHFCMNGRCIVEPRGHPSLTLDDGDFMFMREGLGRVVRGPARARARPIPLASVVAEVPRDRAVRFTVGAGKIDRVVLGGAFCIPDPEGRLFIESLPAVLCVRHGAPHTLRLRAIVEQLVEEADDPAASPVVARLAEVAVLIGLRAYAATGGAGCRPIMAARDRRLARVLAAIHDAPGKSWTIAKLGRIAGMSRSSFAPLFTTALGETPANYLARVRMAQAERLLHDRDLSLPRIAEAVGYASAAAFSVAFKRVRGISPGASRKQTP